GVGFSIGTKGYFGTGNAVGTDLPTKDFWEYDPSINSWTQKADLPIGKCAATGFSIGTKGYIGTGEDSVSGYPVSKTFWEYDPSINVWTQKADFAGLERKHAVAFSIGSKGYMGTGMNYKDFWEYDPNALGINELKEEAAISVYPNPSNAQFNFSSLEKENTIEIFDNTGQPIYYSISKNNFETIDISNKAKGIYFYRITKKAALIQQGKIVLVK
ncbi:MAG: T9SS type A sorting domain-containing protein, partial [Bacteroidia bacterium]